MTSSPRAGAAFRAPTVPRAHRTLAAITVILALFLLGMSQLCPAFHIGAMNKRQAGYQTIWSQLVTAVFGRGVFYTSPWPVSSSS